MPLIMRIIYQTFKLSVREIQHRLLHWAPTDLDRGTVCFPCEEATTVPPLKTEFARELKWDYERRLDA